MRFASFPSPILSLAITLALSVSANAGDTIDTKSIPAVRGYFDRGVCEIELGAGGYKSVGTRDSARRPSMGFAQVTLQAGCMLYSPRGNGLLRGNLEAQLEAFGGAFFEGPGNGLGGVELQLRYNFVQPGARLVPFLQIGGGGFFTDSASVDHTQHLIGSGRSFVLESMVGVRWLLNERWAVTVGPEFEHISNAGTAKRNYGLNVLGGALGIAHAF